MVSLVIRTEKKKGNGCLNKTQEIYKYLFFKALLFY